MTIQLYNTATRRKEGLAPLDPSNVRMYVCGPTVYDRAHLGNARPVLVFDTLFRLLRHVYGENAVTYVRNFTDVDDKINATALARKEAGAPGTLEELVAQRSDETIDWYHADMDSLGALRPTHAPRATAFITQMVNMISGLIDRDFAYARDGHVLFRVRNYDDYGKLSGRSVDDMIAGARVEVAPYKEDPMDFVLWKPSDDDLPGWDSPWGRGRPGWHIECSAMAYELLGAQFDIHGGGNDLQFPHHENEIAQSKCCGHDFANIWMHNEMLQVEGKKMSKSLGNFFTVRDLLDQGVPGEVIRFVMLSTHYRKPMDWTEKKRAEAEATLRKWAGIVADDDARANTSASQVPQTILDALSDDLNTPLAITHLHRLASDRDGAGLSAALNLMGFNLDAMDVSEPVDLGDLAAQLAALRADAMVSKDFGPVDAMKSALTEAGVEVRMSKEGVELVPGTDFDATKLEALK
ncbi:cysteine--tRNA ligase [Tateyamaria sp. ANG-S1]|uniref:cysteine--tRNA ligase n=1 Tax=Tateyamaria sp. ANG-S1 TaxID=1577905 RepID=UPI00057D6C63|nr:cysteine--tRNA ligase [Tateyamaria sp. ANG-S1]KIC48589.1 cysteinyl-tRNA synthetase [Tateyamaria sp. ANG-S1]